MKNKEKYDLSKLKTDSASCDGKIKCMMVYEETSSGIKKLFEKQYTPLVYPYELLIDFANWLEEEYDPKILDEKEKEYLSAVIKPFRKKVKYIEKRFWTPNLEYLSIRLKNNEFFAFPNFKKGKMCKGMEHDKYYTLEELGL
jgi:hypothetical protein|nr:MAG TPA: hypothetical protein [Caudoviricetes sp.]